MVVDAYSTGACLAGEFRKFGLRCAHVQSSTRITADFLASFRPSEFHGSFVVDERMDLETIAAELAKLAPIVCVIAGTETGVEAAEVLAKLLHVPGNDPLTSRLRRDKFEMHERLRGARLSSLRQARCVTVDDALAWATGLRSWPVVVKPAASAGADGVRFCHVLSEVASAADAIIGRRNKLGDINAAALLQERITGQQFIVNAVSMKGRHYISEIWRDDKIAAAGASLVCDREVLMTPTSELARALRDYTVACLDVLGIKEGPSHTELFRTGSGELMLIETAARMQGTIDHDAVVEATGHSHVTLAVLRYADPATFGELLDTSYTRRTNLHCITLCSNRSGILKQNRCREMFGSLKSFRSLIHEPKAGDDLERTIDLFTNAGIVYLAHDDERTLEQDYRTIRDLETSGELFSFE